MSPNAVPLQRRGLSVFLWKLFPAAGGGIAPHSSPFPGAHLPWLRTPMPQTPGHRSTSVLPVLHPEHTQFHPVPSPTSSAWSRLLPCRFWLSLLCLQDIPHVLTWWPGLGRRRSACPPLPPLLSRRPPCCAALHPSPCGHSGSGHTSSASLEAVST